MAPPPPAFASLPSAMEEPPQARALEPKAWSLSLPTTVPFSSMPAHASLPSAKPLVERTRVLLPIATVLLPLVYELRPIATACAPSALVPEPIAIAFTTVVVAL